MGTALAFTPMRIYAGWGQHLDAAVSLVGSLPMTRIAKAFLLLFFFSLCGAAFVATHQLRERAPAPVPREIFAVVHDQLQAFRAADYPGAYRYAAAVVQQKFTLPQFESMVRQRYPEMVRQYRVEFGRVEVQGSNAVVQVFFLGDEGSVRSILYSVIYEGGAWRIDGVEQVKGISAQERLAGSHV